MYNLHYFYLVLLFFLLNFPIHWIIAERYVTPVMFRYNDYATDVWFLKLSEQQDPFRFRMHAQRVCIIAAYPVLRLCDASNIAALSAHDVSNTELPHEFAPISLSRGNSVSTMLEGLHLPNILASNFNSRNRETYKLFFNFSLCHSHIAVLS